MLNNLSFNEAEITVGGKLVGADCTTSENLNDLNVQKSIKTRLAGELAMFMVENNLIEFTQMHDPQSWTTRVRARVFLTPDDQIRIIRTTITNR